MPVAQKEKYSESSSAKHQEVIDARIRAAYNMADYDKAKESLDLTVKFTTTKGRGDVEDKMIG